MSLNFAFRPARPSTTSLADAIAGDLVGLADRGDGVALAGAGLAVRHPLRRTAVIDEAAMLDTRLMAMLTAWAADAGAKPRFGGDEFYERYPGLTCDIDDDRERRRSR